MWLSSVQLNHLTSIQNETKIVFEINRNGTFINNFKKIIVLSLSPGLSFSDKNVTMATGPICEHRVFCVLGTHMGITHSAGGIQGPVGEVKPSKTTGPLLDKNTEDLCPMRF